jgi:hypothetical protein
LNSQEHEKTFHDFMQANACGFYFYFVEAPGATATAGRSFSNPTPEARNNKAHSICPGFSRMKALSREPLLERQSAVALDSVMSNC